jgi:arylsulfatase A-like enzyme
VGYEYGVFSQEYRQAIINCDDATRRLYQEIAHYNNTAIIITSDHGFGGEGLPYLHYSSWHTFLATNLPIQQTSSKAEDIAPTIYDFLDIPPEIFTPRLVGKSLLKP